MVHLTIVNNFDYLNKIVDLGIVEIICSFLKEKIQNNIIVIRSSWKFISLWKEKFC